MKHTEDNKNKFNRIYDRQSKTWYEVTPKQLADFDRWRTKIRRRAQYNHRCSCPEEMRWMCDGLCIDCEYSVSHNELSLDCIEINNSENDVSLYEKIVDPNSYFDDAVCNKVDLAQLRKRIENIMPGAREYFAMKDEEKSNAAIAKELNIPRTTLMSRLKKALATLKVKFSDYI